MITAAVKILVGSLRVALPDALERTYGKIPLVEERQNDDALRARMRLLQYLIECKGDIVSRDELLQHVWGYSAAPLTRTVDVHVSWLRQKIEDDPANPQFILTVHGQGYRFSE